jgi:hypothetical protein
MSGSPTEDGFSGMYPLIFVKDGHGVMVHHEDVVNVA